MHAGLADWCKINEMQVNINKTEYQTFTLNHPKMEMPIKYKDRPMGETDSSTYLGVTFDRLRDMIFQVFQKRP